MIKGIEWLKKSVTLCIHDGEFEEVEKKQQLEVVKEEYNNLNESERQEIIRVLKNQFELNDAIYVLSYFAYYLDLEELKQELFLYLQQTDYSSYIGIMLDLQCTIKVKGCYREKRIFHKKIVDSLKQDIGKIGPYIPIEARNKKRIVIVTEQVLGINHAPTKIVLDFAYELQKNLNYEIMIFLCPSDGQLLEGMWYDPMYMNSIERFQNIPMLIQYKDEEFKGYQINCKSENRLKEYRMMLDLIHAWNPGFVFDMATFNPVVDLMKDFTTLVSLHMSQGCSISEAQILLWGGGTEQEKQEYLNVLNKDQIILSTKDVTSIPVRYERKDVTYIRTEEGLPEDKFLITIVGNRLDEEISAEFIEVMERIIEANEQVVFVFVGEVNTVKQYFADDIFQDKIIYMGYRNNLVETYEMFDLYMNPKRVGGGFSSIMALMAGIPVITLPNCDVAANVGNEFVVNNYDEMIEQTTSYVNDSDFYAKMKETAIERAKRNNDEEMTQYVRKTLEMIYEIMEKQN